MKTTMKKKVLGNEERFGEGDFFDQMTGKVPTHSEGVKEIPLDKIVVGSNVRRSEKNLDELADSISQKGLLQPIVVTAIQGNQFQIVFGHRRFQAFKILREARKGEFLKIKAIIRDKEDFDPEQIQEIQLIENIQREDLTPVELITSLEHLRSKGYSNKVIAGKLGKKEGYVKHLFGVVGTVKANPELERLVKSDASITLSDVHEVRPLPPKKQVKLIQEKLDGIIKTKAELRSRVSDAKRQRNSKKDKKGNSKPESELSLFDVKGHILAVKAFAFDLAKGSKIERERLIFGLKEVIWRLQRKVG